MLTLGVLLLLAACKPRTPRQYIQPDDMEDILVDYYMARAMAQRESFSHQQREYHTALYTDAVFSKHGVTQAQFDSSLVYYYTRSDRFYPIFERVNERLDEKALVLGASEGEIGKYARYNATGDTANVWPDRPTALLLPQPPYNHWDFSIDADSAYRRGDALMIMFMSDFMYQSGAKNGTVYMALDYGDTVVSRSQSFSVSGLTQMRLPEDTTRTIRRVHGFFYLGGADAPTPSTRLLFLSDVQLIRFHTRKAEDDNDEQPAEADSLASDSIRGRLDADSARSGDSLRQGDGPLPADSGAALHRVVLRHDSAASR